MIKNFAQIFLPLMKMTPVNSRLGALWFLNMPRVWNGRPNIRARSCVFALPVLGARWYLRTSIHHLCGVNSEVYCVHLKNAFAQNSPLSLSLSLLLCLSLSLSSFPAFYFVFRIFFLSPSDNRSYFNLQEFMRKNSSLMHGLNP
jgi:hypothetical protein